MSSATGSKSFFQESHEYVSSLYNDFHHNSASQQAIAVALPVGGAILVFSIILLILLFIRKRQLKAKFNKTPDGVPNDSDSDISKPDLIPRPSSVV